MGVTIIFLLVLSFECMHAGGWIMHAGLEYKRTEAKGSHFSISLSLLVHDFKQEAVST
jgi:hypothetical protein